MVLAGTDGLFLIGGTDGTRPVNTVYKSTFDKTGAPQKWTLEPAQLFTPVTDASAAVIGSFVWVYGGTMADGTPTGTVQRGEFGTARQGDDARPVRGPVGPDQPAGAANEHRRVRRQRQPLRRRRQ